TVPRRASHGRRRAGRGRPDRRGGIGVSRAGVRSPLGRLGEGSRRRAPLAVAVSPPARPDGARARGGGAAGGGLAGHGHSTDARPGRGRAAARRLRPLAPGRGARLRDPDLAGAARVTLDRGGAARARRPRLARRRARGARQGPPPGPAAAAERRRRGARRLPVPARAARQPAGVPYLARSDPSGPSRPGRRRRATSLPASRGRACGRSPAAAHAGERAAARGRLPDRRQPGAAPPRPGHDRHLRQDRPRAAASGRPAVAGSAAMSALSQHLQEYLRLRRFVAYLDANNIEFVTVEAAVAWALAPDAPAGTTVSGRRMMAVRGFARYLAGIDPRTEVPPAGLIPIRRRWRPPFIYGD